MARASSAEPVRQMFSCSHCLNRSPELTGSLRIRHQPPARRRRHHRARRPTLPAPSRLGRDGDEHRPPVGSSDQLRRPLQEHRGARLLGPAATARKDRFRPSYAHAPAQPAPPACRVSSQAGGGVSADIWPVGVDDCGQPCSGDLCQNLGAVGAVAPPRAERWAWTRPGENTTFGNCAEMVAAGRSAPRNRT